MRLSHNVLLTLPKQVPPKKEVFLYVQSFRIPIVLNIQIKRFWQTKKLF